MYLFYDETYNNSPYLELPNSINDNIKNKLIEHINSNYNENYTKDEFFDSLKSFSYNYKFAITNQEFKTGDFVWKIWDIAMSLRIMLFNSKTTPDLCESMQILGKNKIITRLNNFK